jgi:hypothetical protein
MLVVMAIIVVVCGIAATVYVKAKAAAKAESGKSLMRQEYLALAMYASSWGESFPSFQVASGLSEFRVGCAPSDSWNLPCEPRPAPMLGSFAYVEPMQRDLELAAFNADTNLPLLCYIFASDYHPKQFEGLYPPDPAACGRDLTCEFPEQIWFVWTDGSLRRQRNRRPPLTFQEASAMGARELFTWPAAFRREMELKQGSAYNP